MKTAINSLKTALAAGDLEAFERAAGAIDEASISAADADELGVLATLLAQAAAELRTDRSRCLAQLAALKNSAQYIAQEP